MYNLNFFIYKILRVISIFFEVLKGVDFKRNIRKSKSKVLQKYYNYEHTIEEDLVNVLNDLKISKNGEYTWPDTFMDLNELHFKV
jgi:hypothetical protein